MNISILLPYKENFVSNKAGAVSLFVNDITKNSIYQKTTKIFGNTIYKKILSNNYINLTFEKKIFFSSNNLYVKSFLKQKERISTGLDDLQELVLGSDASKADQMFDDHLLSDAARQLR